MNRDDIIRMAREAGMQFGLTELPAIKRFAALVAGHEREACTAICREVEDEEIGDGYRSIARECEDRIRARGEA